MGLESLYRIAQFKIGYMGFSVHIPFSGCSNKIYIYVHSLSYDIRDQSPYTLLGLQ